MSKTETFTQGQECVTWVLLRKASIFVNVLLFLLPTTLFAMFSTEIRALKGKIRIVTVCILPFLPSLRYR